MGGSCCTKALSSVCSNWYGCCGHVWYGFNPRNRISRFFGWPCQEMRCLPGVKRLIQLVCIPLNHQRCAMVFPNTFVHVATHGGVQVYGQIIAIFESTSFDFIYMFSKLCWSEGTVANCVCNAKTPLLKWCNTWCTQYGVRLISMLRNISPVQYPPAE